MLKESDIREIELELTGVCNLKCPICSRNFVHSQYMVKKNIRSLPSIIKQLDEYTGLRKIMLAGTLSEPTLYPDFQELLIYLNDRKVDYEIFTNGNTHDPDWWYELGGIISKNSKVIFTICGPTQELHEKYRVGSDLQQILDHVYEFRQSNMHKNDYCQYILFDYNQEYLKNGAMDDIFKQFSHHFEVTAEYRRRLNEKITEPQPGIQPPKQVKCVVDYVFDHRLPIGSKICINCRSLRDKKIYINQFGRVFPCFTHAEFEDKDFNLDYTDILNYKYTDCWLCSRNVDNILNKLGIDVVC